MEIIETNLKFGNMDTRKKTERIILHHSASNTASAEDIQRWHLANGWAGAGYHFLVRKDGSIYRLRPEDKVGAHAYGSNYNSLGICAEGNYEEEVMPEAQKNSIIELVEYLKGKYGITLVQGHRDVCATKCPGKNYPLSEIVTTANKAVVEQPKAEGKIAEGKIATIQRTLNERYGLNIAVDNIYGNETNRALVRALQHELNVQFNVGLVEDGIFGNKTYNACINVRKGARGNITWLIQAMLVCHSFDIDIDGIFGNATDNAVRTFQSRNGLGADGIVGKNTFRRLCA